MYIRIKLYYIEKGLPDDKKVKKINFSQKYILKRKEIIAFDHSIQIITPKN